ncbi:hypothetical protein PSCICF_14910 [Pseudomonas cichorii]|nr:hypothetical protein PSCICF_14910 [Pseudomonas cichorii]
MDERVLLWLSEQNCSFMAMTHNPLSFFLHTTETVLLESVIGFDNTRFLSRLEAKHETTQISW